MKKLAKIVSGALLMLFGLNFSANAAKTDFQRMLEKTIDVSQKSADTSPTCGAICANGEKK